MKSHQAPAPTIAAAPAKEPSGLKKRAEQEAQAKAERNRQVAHHLLDLKSTDPLARLAALKALGKLGPIAKEAVPDVVPQLAQALKDPDSEVRQHAFDAVVKVAGEPKAAVPGLVNALKDRNATVRIHAATLLKAIGPDASDAVPALISCQAAKKVLAHAVEALASIGKAAVPGLIKALADPDEDVRRWAARSLGYIGADARAAVPQLTALLQDDPSAKVREFVATALERIGRKR